MKNNYEILCELREKGLLMPCVRSGIISSKFIDYIDAYEEFIDLVDSGVHKMQAYYQVAETLRRSHVQVMRMIKTMSS